MEKRIAQIVQSRYNKLLSAQQDIFEDVEMYHQMYRAVMTSDDSYPWDYDFVDPLVFSLMRSLMARLNPEHAKVFLEARNGKAFTVKQKNQDILNWELAEMKKTMVFYRFLWRGLLAGRAYIRTGWKYEPAVEVLTGEGENERRIIMRDIINRAEAVNVRFQDVFVPNQNIPDHEEQPYILERISKNFGEMLDENEATGKEKWNVKYLKKIRETRMFTRQIDYGIDLPQEDEDARGFSKEDLFVRSQYVSLIRMVTKKGDVIYVPEKEKEWIMNTEQGNPYWHGHYDYISWTPFPEDDDFFPMGIVQPVADLQISASSTLNQIMTNARKQSNPMWIAGKEASQTPDWQFVNRPDGIIRVAGDVNQIREVQTRDTSDTLISLRREVQTSYERGVGMSSLYSSGVSASSTPQVNKTATGARVIDANLDLNMQLILSIFGAQALAGIGNHILELNAQFITEEQEYKITGGEVERFDKIRPEEVTANFDVVVNPDTIIKISPILKQASLQNMIVTLEGLKTVKTNVKPLVKQLVNSYPEVDVDEEIIIDPRSQAEEAIQTISKGMIPEVEPDMDHKAIITIVQKHLIDNPQYDDNTLLAFAKYLDEHRKWIQAQNPNLVTAQLPEPEVMPTDEQDIMQSLMGGMSNPTQQQQNTIPLDQL